MSKPQRPEQDAQDAGVRGTPVGVVLPEGSLGPLETEVMLAVWASGPVTTRDVHQQLLRRRHIAYTTVMTVMGNLTRKGVLKRYLEGKAYLYTATVTQEELTRSQVAKIMGALLDRFAEPAMSYLVGKLDSIDETRLAELEAEVTRLRRQRAAQPDSSPGQRPAANEETP